jgi:hypothetical protein
MMNRWHFSPGWKPGRLPDACLVILIWLTLSIGRIVFDYPNLALSGPSDPDSLMRLVEVRDYLAGASWTDTLQPRLNPPGTLMHWSRLIDWPLAMLLQLLSSFMPRQTAETVLVAVWPMLLFGPYLFAAAAVARRLAGPEATLPAVFFAFCAVPCAANFMPGNIDHHNVQIVLCGLMLAALVRAGEGGAYGAASGVLAAIMLSIGLETLPVVAFASAGLALSWAVAPRRFASAAGVFGLTFAVGLIAQRLISVPPAQWLATPCDIAALPYVAAGAVAGLGLMALTVLAPAHPAQRMAGLAVLAAAAALAVAAIRPACLKGPFGDLDPRMVTLWLNFIVEAQSVVQLMSDAPHKAIGLFMGPLTALAVGVIALRQARPADRAPWALVVGSLAASLVVAAWQIRAITFSSLLAVFPLAWLVLEARRVGAKHSPAIAAALLFAAYLAPNQLIDIRGATAIHVALGGSARDANPRQCIERQSFAPLAVLPKSVILAPANLGPPILANTGHSVISANYHWNASGILDGIAAFGGSADEAFAIAVRRHAGYVLICPSATQAEVVKKQTPNSFLDRLLSGDAPIWLEPADMEGTSLKIWRVVDEHVQTR